MKGEWLEFIFILVIFLVSFCVVKEDIRSKRIPNVFIFRAFVAGLILYVIAFLTGIMPFADLGKICANSAIACLFGFVIWKIGFWPAGDAKFFMAVSFLLPLNCYSKTYLQIFPAFAFLINIFCVYLFFMGLKFFIWMWKLFHQLWGRWHNKPVCFLRYLKRRLREGIRALKNRAVLKAIVFQMLLKWFIKMSCVAIVFMLLLKKPFALNTFSGYFVLVVLARMIFQIFVNSVGLKRIGIVELRPKINMAARSIKELKKDKAFFSRLDSLRPEGLTFEQVDMLKEYYADRGEKCVYVYETIPFSPFIVLGAVVTILLSGSIFGLFQ